MNFEEYEKRAAETDLTRELPPEMLPEVYLSGKLCGEAGEVIDKVCKIYRDHQGIIDAELRLGVLLELGGVMWYLARLAHFYHSSLGEVADLNIEQLAARKARGTLHGSGDNR